MGRYALAMFLVMLSVLHLRECSSITEKLDTIIDELNDLDDEFQEKVDHDTIDFPASTKENYEELKRSDDLISEELEDLRRHLNERSEAIKEALDSERQKIEDSLRPNEEEIDEIESKFDEKFNTLMNAQMVDLITSWHDVMSLLNTISTNDQMLTEVFSKVGVDINELTTSFHRLTRQIQNQQFNEEEKSRSNVNSGIKQIRNTATGGKNYFTNSHVGHTFAGMHDHPDKKGVCGISEFVGVLNGIEFRTRHNDFYLKKPVTDDKTLNKVEDIEFPAVPPDVQDQPTLQKQIEEMSMWFKAFKDQDYSARDYRKYFKPHLCYLEGAWEIKDRDNETVDRMFEDPNHSINATTWEELREKIRLNGYSGLSDPKENLAWLPTTIMGFDENKNAEYAQFKYRILCHPMKKDLPTSYLMPFLDPHAQKLNQLDEDNFLNSRVVRYDLEGMVLQKEKKGGKKNKGEDLDPEVTYVAKRSEAPQFYTLLDNIMEEIPGKNNYGSELEATAFDSETSTGNPNNKNGKLNGAYYHRPYNLKGKDAMGRSTTQRSYSDRIYVAMTDHKQISGPSYALKQKDESVNVQAKVSYAVPIEVIYLTPLSNWNPHGISYKMEENPSGTGTGNDPYDFSSLDHFYQTPEGFYENTEREGVYVKNEDGDSIKVHAAGIRTLLPKINDVDGHIRQRYPIMPISGEGSSVWKQLNAFHDSLTGYKTTVDESQVFYVLDFSHKDDVSEHNHVIQLTGAEIQSLRNDHEKVRTFTTTKAISHNHQLKVSAKSFNELEVIECDGKVGGEFVCFDQHPKVLKLDE